MSLPRVPRSRRRRCWLQASTVTKYVTVRSEVGWFLGHWKGGSVRCDSSPECTICGSGSSQRLFTYIFVEDEHAEVLVFEIPERLRELADELEDSVGTTLAIRREGTARNARINVVILGHESVDRLDIWPFVDTLGKGSDAGRFASPHSESVPLSEARTKVP